MILASQRLRSAWAMRATVVSISRYSGRLGLAGGTASWVSSVDFVFQVDAAGLKVASEIVIGFKWHVTAPCVLRLRQYG